MNLKKNMSLLGIALVCSGTLATAGNAFAATSNTEQETPVKATVTVDQLSPQPVLPTPNPGGGDNTGNDNTKPNNTQNANIAIAYQPVAFTGSAALTNASGAASIALSASAADGNNKSSVAHVGVKDQTKAKNNWKLQGTFTTTDDQLTGSSIKLSNGKVQMNENGTLKPLANGEVVATQAAELGTTPKNLLTADNTKAQYGIYDYQFDGIQLVIPQASQVAAGDHTGTVNWNLADTPQP